MAIIDYTRLRIIANATVKLNKGTEVEYSGLKIHIICKSIPSHPSDCLHGLSTALWFSISVLFVIFPYRAVDKTFFRLFICTLSTSYMYFYFYFTSVQQPTTERTIKHLYYVEKQSIVDIIELYITYWLAENRRERFVEVEAQYSELADSDRYPLLWCYAIIMVMTANLFSLVFLRNYNTPLCYTVLCLLCCV